MEINLRKTNPQSLIKFLAIEQKSGILSVETPNKKFQFTNKSTLDNSYSKSLNQDSSSVKNYHQNSIFFLGGRITYTSVHEQHNLLRLKDYLRHFQLEQNIEEYLTNFSSNEFWELQEYNCLLWLLQQKLIQASQVKSILLKLIEETIFEILLNPPEKMVFRANYQSYPILQNKSTISIVYQLENKLKNWKEFAPYILCPRQKLILKDQAYLQKSVSPKVYEYLTSWTDRQQSLLQLSRQLNCSLTYVGKALYPYIQKGLLALKTEPFSQ